ncbi:MAG: BatD family protein [Deltaproteobacteria bacterium]|nr:BatD family protein [Deltaproteobacteria bacterium]
MPRLSRLLCCLSLVLVTLCLARSSAWAQGRVDVSAGLSVDEVEVGEAFSVELKAMSERGSTPSNPSLQVPPGFSVSGPTVSSRTMAQFGTGGSVILRGIGASWTLVASETGIFTIRAPTVIIEGQTHTASGSLRVRVVRKGSLPKVRGRDPFAFPSPGRSTRPFGGLLGRRRRAGGRFGHSFPFQIDDDELEEEPDEPVELAPKARRLALTAEPDPYVFVRLVADKERVVVGEQITLFYYVYYRTDLQLTVQREPPLADFLRHGLDKASGADEAVITSVGRWRYHAKLLDQVAIFPLRAGRLKTGVLTTKFKGRRFGAKQVERTSNNLEVTVREPPVEGRPLGYRLGDVGRFTLNAKVTPRATQVGESIAVVARLEGRGALPPTLRVPERTGLEWLKPEKREQIRVRSGRIAGWRTFGYAVRFADPGVHELGTIELPYFDPDKGEYDVAKVELGTVSVSPADPSTRPDGGLAADSDDGPFATLAKPRTSLRPYEPTPDLGFEPKLLWAFVLTPPLGVAATGLLLRAGRSWASRRKARKRDPAVMARAALGQMGKAEDGKDRVAAAERALHLAIEAATTLRSRGVLLAELGDKLAARGLAADLRDEVVELLERCSEVRFEPALRATAADEVVRRAQRLTKELLRTSTESTGGEAEQAKPSD